LIYNTKLTFKPHRLLQRKLAIKVQELAGGGWFNFIINNAKLLQFKQNNFKIVQRIHKAPLQ